MPLTAEQTANTTADAFDVRLRYFAACADYTTLTLAYYEAGSTPVGWSVGTDDIVPDGTWVEVTELIEGSGSLVYEWSGSVVSWSANLTGISYTDEYFGVDRAILCMRRITRPGYDGGWTIWWVGCISGGAWRNDYRNGLAWRRTVRGTDVTLRLTDGPRLTVGRLNVTEGATATASSELETPSVEAQYGEFIGSTARVNAGNATDRRMQTVWISQDTPNSTTETIRHNAHVAKVDEVFFRPVAGYDSDKSWWVEFVNASNSPDIIASPTLIVAYTADEQVVGVRLPAVELDQGERLVLCANRATFEAITGGARAAKAVMAADEMARSYVVVRFYENADGQYSVVLDESVRVPMTLNLTGGYVFYAPYFYNTFSDKDGVKWGVDRAFPPGMSAVAGEIWTGTPVDISGISDGQSIRRIVTGGGANGDFSDSETAADWKLETYPRPGDKFFTNRFEWLLVTLPAHTSTLAASVSAASTDIQIEEGTTGWPETGDGVIEGDTFGYTGRTATTLTGVTGIDDPHVAGATLNPYANGVAQTGWHISQVKLRRRPGTAYLRRWEVWVSESADPRTPDGADPANVLWQADYDEPHFTGSQNVSPVADIVIQVAPDTGARWARCLLINILEMWPETGETTSARAKLNEVEITLDDLTLGDSGAWDYPGVRAADAAEYLVAEYSWLTLADFHDATQAGWGEIGSLALAIRPLPQVLDDLARMHGCLIRYGLDGQLNWERDPWWPGGNTAEPDIRWERATLRGEIEVSQRQTNVTGVAVTAQDGEGRALERVTMPRGAGGSGVKEVTGVVVANQVSAQLLASALLFKEQNQDRCTLRPKGVGEWCWPTRTYHIYGGGSNDPAPPLGVWIAERVTWTWSLTGERKTWETAIDCRRMYAE